jgi:TIGR03009 family protein
MRSRGFALVALLAGVTAVAAQQPVPPVPPGAPVQPPVPPAAPPVDAKLDAHLNGWQKNMGDLVNFRFTLELVRTDAVFKADRKYSGVVLCMKPNFAVLRLNNDGDKTGTDYEAFICDGKSVFEYNGLAKTITEWKLPAPAPGGNPNGNGTDNIMLDFLKGMNANAAKARFELTLFKEDANYVYLDVKPLQPKDKQEFTQLRMALYGPNTKWPYLPAQVYLSKPNGDTEQWKLKEPQTNIPGLTAEHFKAQPLAGWKQQQGGAAPQGQQPKNIGQPKLPPGKDDGLVRPK